MGPASERPSTPSARAATWQAFREFCERLQHGEIDKLKIQDGLPMLAETVRQKVKFTS